jgi:hypothetical protein
MRFFASREVVLGEVQRTVARDSTTICAAAREAAADELGVLDVDAADRRSCAAVQRNDRPRVWSAPAAWNSAERSMP